MKQIKFMAWHDEDSKMGEVYQLDLIDGFVELKFRYSGLAMNYPIERVTLRQYIGMKDKKGNCIYVGDIVQYLKFMGIKENKYKEVRRKVIFDSENLCFTLSCSQALLTCQFSHEFQVVGNIYENPELLND